MNFKEQNTAIFKRFESQWRATAASHAKAYSFEECGCEVCQVVREYDKNDFFDLMTDDSMLSEKEPSSENDHPGE